jgi:hypothetical protein
MTKAGNIPWFEAAIPGSQTNFGATFILEV